MTEQRENNLPLVSIVIPMLNEVKAIERCITSILSQDYPTDKIEIVVVDGFSTDGSREIVQNFSKNSSNVKLEDNPIKRTPAALNIGIKKSTGSVVIILGAHTKIKSDFIKLNILYMQKMDVLCTGGTQVNIGETFIQQAIGDAMGSIFGIPSAPYRFANKARFVDTVVYAAYNKKLFDEIGYFDEELHISEDAELNWRIRKAGHKIYFTPEIVSYYYPRPCLKSLAKQFLNYGILRANVIKKHFDASKIIHLTPPAFILVSLLSLIFGIFYPIFLKLFAGIWLFYLMVLFTASVITSFKKRNPGALFIYPFIFAILHLCWGSGFIVGLFKTYK